MKFSVLIVTQKNIRMFFVLFLSFARAGIYTMEINRGSVSCEKMADKAMFTCYYDSTLRGTNLDPIHTFVFRNTASDRSVIFNADGIDALKIQLIDMYITNNNKSFLTVVGAKNVEIEIGRNVDVKSDGGCCKT